LDSAWLAALWLTMAWSERRPGLYAAFQGALSASVLYAITSWLEVQPWVIGQYPEGLTDPRSLQAYGIGLALLGLVWVVARLSLRAHEQARQLMEHDWPIVDRVVLALLVLGQLFLAVWGIVPELGRELRPVEMPLLDDLAASHAPAYGPGAW